MSEEQIVISEKEERRQEIERIFNPDNCQVIRKELFASLRDPAVTIRNGSISFNTACINDFVGVVYVKLLYDSNLRFLSVTECDENDKHALRWCVAKTDKRKSRRMRCPEFTGPLFEQLGWNSKCRYKVLGYKIVFEGKVFFVFDLNVPQIFNEKPKKGGLQSKAMREEINSCVAEIMKLRKRVLEMAGDFHGGSETPIE